MATSKADREQLYAQAKQAAEGGIAITAFCREQGVSYGSFAASLRRWGYRSPWRKEHGRSKKSVTTTGPRKMKPGFYEYVKMDEATMLEIKHEGITIKVPVALLPEVLRLLKTL